MRQYNRKLRCCQGDCSQISKMNSTHPSSNLSAVDTAILMKRPSQKWLVGAGFDVFSFFSYEGQSDAL